MQNTYRLPTEPPNAGHGVIWLLIVICLTQVVIDLYLADFKGAILFLSLTGNLLAIKECIRGQ